MSERDLNLAVLHQSAWSEIRSCLWTHMRDLKQGRSVVCKVQLVREPHLCLCCLPTLEGIELFFPVGTDQGQAFQQVLCRRTIKQLGAMACTGYSFVRLFKTSFCVVETGCSHLICMQAGYTVCVRRLPSSRGNNPPRNVVVEAIRLPLMVTEHVWQRTTSKRKCQARLTERSV
jgi:hypothetical protein